MIMETTVHSQFISHELCDEILNFSLNNFEIDYRTNYGWHARTNRDNRFNLKIKELISKIAPFNPFHIVWINLTEYENGRSLHLHNDERSNFTFTICLTDNYIGGNFIVEDREYDLKKGDCIMFNGNKHLHGVKPVTHGYRAALNIWIVKGNPSLI